MKQLVCCSEILSYLCLHFQAPRIKLAHLLLLTLLIVLAVILLFSCCVIFLFWHRQSYYSASCIRAGGLEPDGCMQILALQIMCYFWTMNHVLFTGNVSTGNAILVEDKDGEGVRPCICMQRARDSMHAQHE